MRESFLQTVTGSKLFSQLDSASREKFLNDIRIADEEQFGKIQQEFLLANQQLLDNEKAVSAKETQAQKEAAEIQNEIKDIQRLSLQQKEKNEEKTDAMAAEDLLKEEDVKKPRSIFAKFFGFLFGKK